MNKKAQIGENLIYWIIISFITLIVIAFIIWIFGNINDSLSGIPLTSEGFNFSKAAADTFGQVNSSLLPSAKILSFVLLFSMVMGMFFIEFLSRKHPAYFFLDLLIVIFAFILSVFISNRYEEFLTGLPISDTLVALKAGSSIMLHLPRWVAVIGIIGMTLSYMGIIRRRGTESFNG